MEQAQNPLLEEFNTPHGVPPFASIQDDHYRSAFEKAFELHKQEVVAIVENKQAPSFDNTIAALDYSGAVLSRVLRVFFPKHSADTNETIQEIAKEVAPQISAHYDEVLMNDQLFKRVETVYSQAEKLELGGEQRRLLQRTYNDFVRGGAKLEGEAKERLTEINQRMSLLKVQFGENLLAENNHFKMILEKKEDLSGLPEAVIDTAARTATEAGHEGKWVFTLHNPSWIPFLQFSDRRDLREKLFTAYMERGNHDDERDNKQIARELARLRIEKANLLGFETHAHYVLDDNMAKTPDKVEDLLGKLWSAALPAVKAEASELQKMIKKEAGDLALKPWDWWYYTEKLRKEKYDLSDEELRPYFQLKNVQKGAFDIASRLYGLKFIYRDDVPKYHEDVKVVEVQEADGRHVGILYLDYFTRASKRQGAWMTGYRGQKIYNGEFITPVVANVFNFSKGTDEKPSLLSLDEVSTVFHEFGHALHGLLSKVTYPGLAGTNVSRDFVELPSQFMENWAMEPSVMKTYAVHSETGEAIPDSLIEKITKSKHFNQGFATTEYLAASFLDMKWHTVRELPEDLNVMEFEKKALSEIGLIPEIISRYRSTYFAHIFSGGYSSGYYSYIWSAVLDSDSFAAFKEQENLFEPETATKFREFILSKGNTAEPMDLFVQFRGREPRIEPLLEKRGLKIPTK